MQLQFTTLRCLAPDPAGGANSAIPELLAGFWGQERNGKWEIKWKEMEKKGRVGKKGKRQGSKLEKERRKGEGGKGKGVRRKGEERRKMGKEGRNFCAVVIFP